MRRSSVLLVSLILLVGASAVVPASVGADETPAETYPRIVTTNGSANYLALPADEVSRTGTATNGLSLSTAIASDTATLDSDLTRITFEQSFEEATTDAKRRTVIRDTADRVEQRKASLQHRDRAVIRGYTNGSLTAAEFVRERARIHNAAEQLQTTIQRVDRIARTDDRFSLSTPQKARLAALAAELEVLQGPVSDHIDSAAAGKTPGQMIYAEASDDGYTIAYVTDDTYVRETYLGDERKPNETDTFTTGNQPAINLATNRGYALYPWVTNHSVSPNSYGPFGSSGIYRFTVDFSNGELTAHLDGATTNVFRESQRHGIAAIPVSDSYSKANGSLHARVNQTYDTGPTKLSLTRDGTDTPVNGTVTVDGKPVGHTGDDGTLWFVEPRGPVSVEATTDDENVTVYLPS